MSPESQRIAIAEACGWKDIARFDMTSAGGRITINGHLKDTDDLVPIPDYLNDLNAMHEAEKVLIDSGKALGYGQNLWRVHGAGLMMWNATAAQRAESFLRTIGKWHEDTPVQQREKTSSGIAAAHK